MMKILILCAPQGALDENPGLRRQAIAMMEGAVKQLDAGKTVALLLPPSWHWEVVEVDRIVIGESHAEQEPDVAPAGSP